MIAGSVVICVIVIVIGAIAVTCTCVRYVQSQITRSHGSVRVVRTTNKVNGKC